MGRTICSTDKKYLIVEKEIDGIPCLILMPKDYAATDKSFYKMGSFELFNLVETYEDYIEHHRKYIKANQGDLYDWEVK